MRLLLATLVLLSCSGTRVVRAEEATPAPFHDLAQIVRASRAGAIEVPARRDVLLLKTYDGDPALERDAEKGLLLREVVRQAFLIAAREGLGLPTRDQSLREPFPAADSKLSAAADQAGSLQIVSSVPRRFPRAKQLRVSVFREQPAAAELLWQQSLSVPKWWWNSLETLSNQLEKWSRNEWVTVLKEAGFEGTPNRWLDDGPVPEDVLHRAAQWNAVSQFFVIRSLHRLIREDGESPQRLAILAESYARLGTLTAWHWGPAHQVYKARAMLYSQRLMVRSKGSSLGREARAYVLALLGRHQYALAVPLTDLQAQGAEFSATTQVIDAYCRFQDDRLRALAEQPELRPLVRYLQFLAVEPIKSQAIRTPVATALLEEQPDCFLPLASLAARGPLGSRLGAGQQIVMQHVPALYRRLSEQPELPPGIAELVQRGAGPIAGAAAINAQPLDNRRELIAALRDAGEVANDQAEPSLACFAQLIVEEGFAAAALAAHGHRDALGLPTEQLAELIRQLAPLLEGHPYEEGIRSYGRSPAENQQRTAELLAWIDPADFETTLVPMALALAKHHPPAWNAFGRPIENHLDLVYRDLLYRIEAGGTWGGGEAAQRLARISLHAPMGAVGQLRYRWNVGEVAEQARQFEERFGNHPQVLHELGRRYREAEDWEGAERVLTRLVEIEPSQRAYQGLAAVYEKQEQRDKWLETLEAFLTTPDVGLSHSRVRANIAEHYMAQGDYQRALPYAEAAAQSWAGWAMATAVHCHEALGNLAEAEAWLQRKSQRYDGSALEWYFWCRRTGTGNVRAAAAYAESFVQRLGTPLPPNELLRVAVHQQLSGEAEEALATFRRLYKLNANPYDGLHAALIAHQLDQPDLRDELLQSIAQSDSNAAAAADKAATIQLAGLLQGALQQGEPPQLDRSAVDELIRGAPAGEPTNLNYFVGKFLWLCQQQEAAEGYLRLAARSPLGKFNRDLAGALLRDHGIDLQPLSHKEPLPEKPLPGEPASEE